MYSRLPMRVALSAAFALVGQEFARLNGAGGEPGEVEINAADEFFVGAEIAGNDFHGLQLAIDELVDVVVLRFLLPLVAASVAHADDRGGGIGPLRRFQVELDALGNPIADQLVVWMPDIGADAPDVRDGAGGFEEHQTLIGGRAVEAAGADVVGEGAVVEQRVVATERKLEAELAFLGAVAGAGVAAHAREGGLDVFDEADNVRGADAADGDGDFD
jgi:hypothetical protein